MSRRALVIGDDVVDRRLLMPRLDGYETLAFDPARHRGRQPTPGSRTRTPLGRPARVFGRMADEVRARQERLRAEVRELRIAIGETRQADKVAEITQTDYFCGLRSRAGELRRIIEG